MYQIKCTDEAGHSRLVKAKPFYTQQSAEQMRALLSQSHPTNTYEVIEALEGQAA